MSSASLLRFGIAFPPVTEATNTMGVQAHARVAAAPFPPLLQAPDLVGIQQGGFKTLRTDLLWSAVEKTPGQYDFSAYDGLVNTLQQKGIRPMFILGLGHPAYGQHLSIYPPGTEDAFSRYAQAAVRHFANRGIAWELVQQPNQHFFWHPQPDPKHYAQLAMQLLPRLQALDPTGHFVAPSIAGHDLAYQEALYQEGLLNHVDAVSVHPYRTQGRIPESILENYEKTQTLIEKYAPPGKSIPVILGEWGYSAHDPSPQDRWGTSVHTKVSEARQANYAVRQALLGMMLKTPINIWYNWKGDIMKADGDPTDPEQHFGLVQAQTLQPKPAYYALQTLAQQLGGYRFQQRVHTVNPNDFVLAFTGPANTQKWVAWTTAKEPREVTVQGHLLTLTETPQYRTISPN